MEIAMQAQAECKVCGVRRRGSFWAFTGAPGSDPVQEAAISY
jgi:hypothetical protein